MTPPASTRSTFRLRTACGCGSTGNLLIDQWQDQEITEHSITITLNANTVYRIVLEHYQLEAGNGVRLAWQPPGVPKHVISGTALLLSQDCNDNGLLDECDLLTGTSTDVNSNGQPDECETIGDMNCDGFVNFDDIDGFVLALVDQATYEGTYDCEFQRADCDGNGLVTFDDISAFVALLSGAG